MGCVNTHRLLELKKSLLFRFIIYFFESPKNLNFKDKKVLLNIFGNQGCNNFQENLQSGRRMTFKNETKDVVKKSTQVAVLSSSIRLK